MFLNFMIHICTNWIIIITFSNSLSNFCTFLWIKHQKKTDAKCAFYEICSKSIESKAVFTNTEINK